ncbi:unnamed protein product [Didymodactylos carnosus]|uniref:Uncharacterized protein n=1 Tax=Didymodactylos carnosus TaxID=1234261 RepID=A0A8S2EJI1_9BILA|nr:unnamed protein product [Didymodactylos carnosus]CAF4049456.1 unnamed protein product [Didymodactylos carnosus]
MALKTDDTLNVQPKQYQQEIFEKRQEKNLETFSLVWLDENVNCYINVQLAFRQVINFLKPFDNEDECERYIKQVKNEKLILIVSKRYAENITSRIHDQSQLSVVYVYSLNDTTGSANNDNETWANKYTKIITTIKNFDQLVLTLAKDQCLRERNESLTAIFSIFNREENSCKNLKTENNNFMWSQLFIEVLLRMEYSNTSKNELITICKQNYAGNTRELSVIDEFEHTYSSDRAIWWYTRECCLYRLLNKALQESVIRVYRYQVISIDEINRLKNSIGEFISMNSFLSTSRNSDYAISIISTTNNNSSNDNNSLQPILFEINANTRLTSAQPFADIKLKSYFQQEEEILFMLGSIFSIKSVEYEHTKHFWLATLEMCSEDDQNLKGVYEHEKQQLGERTNLISLGNLLDDMGEYEKGHRYFEKVLHELVADSPDISKCYEGLGSIVAHRGDYNSALALYNKALEQARLF